VRTETRALLSRPAYRTRLLVALSLGWAALQAGRFLVPPLLPRIQADLVLSPALVGGALTGFGLVYAVVQYPAGAASDRLSRASLLLPAFLVLLGSFALFGISTTAWLFLAAILLLGVGKGLYASPSRALLGDLYAEHRGTALGVYSAGTDLGGLAAAGIAVVVLATPGWRAAFLPVVAVLAVITVLYVVWNREGYGLEAVPLAPTATAGRVLATRGQRERLLAFSLFYFAVGGVTNFYPTLLVEARGLSEGLASASFALIFLVGLFVKPGAGAASDRLPRLLVAIGGLLLGAIGLAVVLVGPGLLGVAVGTVLTALGYKIQFPIADALVIEAAPAGDVGGDLGAARGAFLAANAAGPGVVGLIAEVAGYALAFWVMAASLVASAGLLALQYRREGPQRRPDAVRATEDEP
jgi:predicted MFS family arabinose efflux permease